MSAPAVGIDLGTTNSVVAVSLGGKPQVLIDKPGGPLIPSVVSFPEGGPLVVGRPARLRRALDPANTVYSVKRLLGRPFKSEECRRARARMAFDIKEGADSAIVVATRGGEHTLPELSAMILREVRRVAEGSLGEKIDRCVITVPANFNELQRSSTKVAGRIAELEVIRILNEPTAAALAYGYGRGTREKICIFDFGGGTFDVTLLELSGNVFEVLATAGDTFLGGDDIDIALTESLAEPFERATRVDITRDRSTFDMLRDVVEQAKIELSFKDRMELDFQAAGGKPQRFQKVLTREDVEAVAAPFISRTFDVCAEALKLANLRPTDLTAVILVGGSTRIPAVRQRVAQFFGRGPLTNLPPEEVVGLGASILAEALTGGKRTRGASGTNVRSPAPPASVPPPSVGVPGANAPSVIEDNRRPTLNQAPAPPATRKSSPDTLRMGVGSPKNEPAPAAPTAAGPQPPGARRPSAGTFDMDDPFAELSGPKALPTAPAAAPPVKRSQPSDLTWEPVKDVPGPLGKLDEPSFMGRLPKGPEGPEVQLRGAEAPGASAPMTLSALFDDPTSERTNPSVGAAPGGSAPAFNLEDPSFVGKLPATPAVAPRKEASSPGFSVDDPLAMPDPLASTTVRDPLASPTKGGRFGAPAFGQSLDDQAPADTSDLSMSFSMTADDIFGGGKKAPAAAAVATAAASAASAASAAGVFAPPSQRPPPPAAPPAPSTTPTVHGGPPPTAARESGARAAPQPPPAASPMTSQSAPQPRPATIPPASNARPGLPPAPGGGSGVAAIPPAGASRSGPLPSPGHSRSGPLPQGSTGSRAVPSAAAPLLLDVTPFSLGVETAGGLCEAVIRRNATIPVEQTRVFATTSDDQESVILRIAQGESRRFGDNQALGELELTGLRAAPRGEVAIAVTFELEADGTLQVRARDVESGREQFIRVTLLTIPSEAAQAEMAARSRAAAPGGAAP